MLKKPLTVAAVLTLTLGLAGCGDETSKASARKHTPLPENSSGADCTYQETGDAARDVDLPPAKAAYSEDVEAIIETNMGDINATLAASTAPCTVSSFASLASQGFFDDTPCPRIVTEGIFVLQCGDPTGTTSGGPGYAFDDELTGSETYPGGTLAMANSGANTNGSQFFIVYADSANLTPDYTVFGTVDEASLKVIEKMAANGSDNSNPAGGGAPLKDIDIDFVDVG